MELLKSLMPLRQFCRQNPWPRLSQWHHWIYSRAPIAENCVKKVGGRYLIDQNALQQYLMHATLEELQSQSTSKKA